MEPYKINNVVASAVLSDKINLEELMKLYPCAKRINRFHAYKIKVHSGILVIFNNAKVNATGYKTISGIKEAIKEFSEKVSSNILSIRIVNITATSKLNKPVDFKQILKKKEVFYEPDLFPGIYFKFGKSKIILFHSAKYILTGFTSIEDLNKYNKVFLEIVYG